MHLSKVVTRQFRITGFIFKPFCKTEEEEDPELCTGDYLQYSKIDAIVNHSVAKVGDRLDCLNDSLANSSRHLWKPRENV